MVPPDAKLLPPLEEVQSLAAFAPLAKLKLPKPSWEYISGGEADTMERNEAAFGSFCIRPRILTDVTTITTKCNLLGRPCSAPLYLSSIAKGGMVSGTEGEAAFVRASVRAEIPFIVPSLSSAPYEKVWAAAPPGQSLPFQFYMLGDEGDSIERLQEALRRGVNAVVVTVDANAPRSGAFRAVTGSLAGAFPSTALTWERLADVKKLLPVDMPLYLKGVQTAEDALTAARIGVQGMIVSNHGGRCCGDARSSLAALEEVAGALREEGLLDTLELLFDGGVRTGRDVLKALCLGANGVGIGRPYYWACGSYGEDGIVAMVDVLSAELRHAMSQAGRPTLESLCPEVLCRMEAPAYSFSPRLKAKL